MFGHATNTLNLDPERKLFSDQMNDEEWRRFLDWAKQTNLDRRRVSRDVILVGHNWGDSPCTPFRVVVAPESYDTNLALQYDRTLVRGIRVAANHNVWSTRPMPHSTWVKAILLVFVFGFFVIMQQHMHCLSHNTCNMTIAHGIWL